jgi:hypothetical protein
VGGARRRAGTTRTGYTGWQRRSGYAERSQPASSVAQ